MEERPRRVTSNRRLVAVGVVLVLAWTTVGFRLTVVQGARADEFAERGLDQRLERRTLPADRGTIFDRDGRELAVTIDSVSVYANPREMADPTGVAMQLAPLVDRRVTELIAELTSDSLFVYLARQLSPEEAEPIREADLPGVYFLTEPKRVYPAGGLVVHVIGIVRSDDNEGLEGLELQYDRALAGTPGELLVERDPEGLVIPQGEYRVVPAEQGSDLVTTIKVEVQYAAEQALIRGMARTGAKSGSIVVIDPTTGEILAMVNLPAYDPNDREAVPRGAIRNRAVTDVFEPGSTQKAVTVSGALESGLVTPATSFDIPDEIEIQDTVFEDFTEHADRLTVTQIVTHSSNLGTILLGELMGAPRLHDALSAFGEGAPTGIDFPGEAPGVLRPAEKWCLTTCLAGTSIGYHVSVTPLQMAMVYAAIANDGVWVQPHLVKEIVDGSGSRQAIVPQERQVISARTARQMRVMLEAVVESGTGSLAAVEGYRVGGKTGTTEKYLSDTQSYSEEDVVASFIGMAPVDAPRVVIAVVLDGPVEDASGGRGAAPIFAEVMLAALHQLGISPDA
ncbi:MAG: penicillin-binding protein 2 [Actinomycetota bacterium]|nr:penicillin-binding protein 2 [Actinomycetota bacterium]